MKRSSKELQLILFAGLVLMISLNIQSILSSISGVFSLLSSLIAGAILAFVANVPMKRIEKLYAKLPMKAGLRRSLSILTVFLLALAILVGMVLVVLPSLATTIGQLSSSIPAVVEWLVNELQDSKWVDDPVVSNLISQIQSYLPKLSENIVAFLGRLTKNFGGIFSGVFNTFIAIVFMFSLLGSKEFLVAASSRVLRAFFPPRFVQGVKYIAEVSVETYDNFLLGQIIEACIISILIMVSFQIVGLPYGVMTGILAGVLSFVPYVGPFIACAIAVVLILPTNPLQALLAFITFQVVQLIEGNVIYPRVVGNSIGLPALFTLAAATIGGSLFGIVGLIFFTPFVAVLYRLLREIVVAQEQWKAGHEGKEINTPS